MCGLGILVLGTAANIYAEEEYSETHAETVLPPSLKEIEAKFDLLLPQSSPPANMVDSFNRLGDKSFNDPLSFNRSAFGSGEFFFIVCVCPFLNYLRRLRICSLLIRSNEFRFSGEENEKLASNNEVILQSDTEKMRLNNISLAVVLPAAPPIQTQTNHSTNSNEIITPAIVPA